jgi:hypothetical protein
MASTSAIGTTITQSQELRRWISRTFVVSILVYLVVIGYLLAEAVTGASRWAPYGVNIPLFIALIIASELAIILTAAAVFREDSGIWPPAVSEGWAELRGGSVTAGLRKMMAGAWDVPLIDLRLRTTTAIYLGRVNRIAALVPLAYALAASAGGAPWGLRTSALVDIAITLAVWVFMELVMVRPAAGATARPSVERRALEVSVVPGVAPAVDAGRGVRALKQSRYEVRLVEPRDLERIEEMERIKWKDQGATREKILSRLRFFPKGQVTAVHVTDVDGVPVRRTVVAWCTWMPANESQVRAFRSWNEVTSHGTISGCDPHGNVLVGVNLTSVTEGAAYVLLGEMLAAVLERGMKKMIGGSRLNGFVSFNARRRAEGKRSFSADEYARLREIRGYRINELRIDEGLEPLPDDEYTRLAQARKCNNGESPSLSEDAPDYVCSNVRGYMGIPGAHMVGVVPDYFDDPASDNYGVVIDWPNPLPLALRHFPWLKRWAARQIRREVRAEWEARKQRWHELSRRRMADRVPEYLRREAEAGAGSTASGDVVTAPRARREMPDRPGTHHR